MKTKEEVIKKEWGEHYNIVKENLNKDEWCIDKGHKLFSEHRIYDNDENFDFVFDGNWDYCEVLKYRPKSLQGIENNNGWIRIESEADLPETQSISEETYCINILLFLLLSFYNIVFVSY